jgi:hypothetical protein
LIRHADSEVFRDPENLSKVIGSTAREHYRLGQETAVVGDLDHVRRDAKELREFPQ